MNNSTIYSTANPEYGDMRHITFPVRISQLGSDGQLLKTQLGISDAEINAFHCNSLIGRLGQPAVDFLSAWCPKALGVLEQKVGGARLFIVGESARHHRILFPLSGFDLERTLPKSDCLPSLAPLLALSGTTLGNVPDHHHMSITGVSVDIFGLGSIFFAVIRGIWGRNWNG